MPADSECAARSPRAREEILARVQGLLRREFAVESSLAPPKAHHLEELDLDGIELLAPVMRFGQASELRVIPCLMIPIFDHASTIRRVVESLASAKLPLLIVDDGSSRVTRAVLDRIVRDFDWVEVHHHVANQGKGAALVTGYRIADARGFTHVVQLDADAQHDANDVGRFLASARAHPEALVLGDPIFDADAPKSRVYGRKLSVGMVWLATLSRTVRDPLCGFRCVPLAPVMPLLDRVRMGRHMDFEPELAVRLVWSGVAVVNVKTRVRYFPFGLSHFDLVWDDLRLAWLYARLTLGMFVRAGGILQESMARRVPARARGSVKT